MADTPAGETSYVHHDQAWCLFYVTAPGSNEPANPVPSQLPQTGNQSTPQPSQMMATYQPVNSNFTPKQSEYQPMPGNTH